MYSFAKSGEAACPIYCMEEKTWESEQQRFSVPARHFASLNGFQAKPGKHCLLPNEKGELEAVVFGINTLEDPFQISRLATLLLDGVYRFATPLEKPDLVCLGWLLGTYRFTRYRVVKEGAVQLIPPEGVNLKEVTEQAQAIAFGRDLINTPANDLGPDEFEQVCRIWAEKHHVSCAVIKGEELLTQNFPLIHAVGRASIHAPRLIDITCGPSDAPKVTLVGKGVTFDTGGLNIKPESGMLLMKKDMGGAATALALAQMIILSALPVRLRILLPIVENAISGSAFRPGDVLQSRKGLSVEIGNTDAEGRLILADALALADEEEPDLLIDFATLTGAARVALGPDLPPFYTRDEKLSADLARLPLWQPYMALLDSKIADINHISGGPFAGSVTAALFLSRFVEKAKSYIHFDIYGWNPSTKPARPEGGEIQGARLVHALLKERYGSAL
jgi:leucyl aminopeptidase